MRTDATLGKHKGLTLLIVPTDALGLEVRGIATMGARIVNDAFSTDVRVPESAVVGQAGIARQQMMRGALPGAADHRRDVPRIRRAGAGGHCELCE